MPKARLLVLIGIIAAIVIGLSAIDLLRDPQTPDLADIALDLGEKLVLVVAMAGVAWTVQRVRDLTQDHEALSSRLSTALAEGDSWRAGRRAEIAALGRAIEEQLRAWGLTAAEIDIAGLLLKGASLKDIARARHTSEATIRQQTQGIYRKSGLSGRAELSAFFLETLFAAAEDGAAPKPALRVVETR